MSEQVDLTDYADSDSNSEWTEKQLGDIFDSIYSGGTPKRGVDEYYGGDIPFVKIEDLNRQQGEGVSTAEESITEYAVEDTSVRAFESGSLLLTIYGSLAETAMVNSKVATNQGILGLWDAPDDNVVFVRYAIADTQSKLASLSRQTTQANLGKGIVKKHRIPVPPLSEQRKIATILYNVDQAIQKTEEIIEEYKAIKSKVLQNLVFHGIDNDGYKDVRLGPKQIEVPSDWRISSFGDVSDVQQGLQIAKSNRFKEDGENRYQYITVQYLNDPQDPVNNWYIENPRDTVVCNKEDVLMTRTGNTGEIVTGAEGAFHNNFFKIQFDRDVLLRDYLVHYLESKAIQDVLISYAGTTTIPDLNHGEFFNIPVLLPPIDEQKLIAEKGEVMSEIVSVEEEYLNHLQRLKQGLMQDLLSGTVRTTDTNIEVPDEIAQHG